MKKTRRILEAKDLEPPPVAPAADAQRDAQRTLAQLVDELRQEHSRALLLGHLVRVLDAFLPVEKAPRYLLRFPGQGTVEPKFDDVFAVKRELVLAARASRRRFREMQQMLVDGLAPAARLPLFSIDPQDAVVPFDDGADARGLGDIVENPEWGSPRRRVAGGM